VHSSERFLVVQANEVTVYGIAPAAEGQFLTEAFQSPSFAVGTDGIVTIAATSATDMFLDHGVYGGMFPASSFRSSADTMLCIVQ
jgi:hypothetical protein